MARTKRTTKMHGLGSPPAKHAENLRAMQRRIERVSKRAIEAAKSGKCGMALIQLVNAAAADGGLEAESRGIGKSSKKQTRRTKAGYLMVDRSIDAFKEHCLIKRK